MATGLVGGVTRWLDVLPHPALVCEIAPEHVAVARWTRGGRALEAFAVEPLPAGAIVPSPTEANLANAGAVRVALERILSRVHPKGHELALLVPDPVVRVFILPFDTFPKRPDEAIPLLRWRLKKSVPFDVGETVVSYWAQPPRGQGIDVVAALAWQRILREYEELVEAVGVAPGVVLSSTLATLPLLEEGRTTLLARLSGASLTTVIVRDSILCVYRCTEMGAGADGLAPQALLDEIYPAVAYCQDTLQENVEQIRLAGLGKRYADFRQKVEREMGCPVRPLLVSAALGDKLAEELRPLLDQQLDALVGWRMNRGA